MSGSEPQKVAIITGASQGIGAGLVDGFRRSGYAVVGTARSVRPSDDPGYLTVEGDIAQAETADQVVEQALNRFGRIDSLINNAGIYIGKPFIEYTVDDYAAVTAVNLAGFFHITQRAIRHMVEQGGGHVVNVSSVAGRIARAGSGVYNLTKFGVGAFSESLRQEGVPIGVRVTLIEPGAVGTELAGHNRPEVLEQMAKRFAGIELLSAEDIANAILYAIGQPAHVSVNEVLVRPSGQVG